jgi:hypothetical protein
MRTLVCGLLLSIFAATTIHAQEPQTDSRTTLLTIRVDTAYDDSDDSVALIQSIVTQLPTGRAVLEKGTTLSQFVLRQYGFGPSDLPRSYAVVEQAILSENQWSKPEDAKAGPITIPLLPRRALINFNPRKALNSVPKIWVLGGIRAKFFDAREARDFASTSSTRLDENRLASQSELINVATPISSVAQLMTDPILSKYANAFDYPIAVRLASDSLCKTDFQDDDHHVLTDDERKLMSQLLTKDTQRDAIVFVMDTGWPNKTAYDESRTQLWNFLDSFWRRNFGLGLPHGPYAEQYSDPSNLHCRCIDRALREFKQIDPSQHVKIIYVPMTREQDGGSVITDFLQTSYLYEWENMKHVLPPNDVLKISRQFAEDAVSKKFPTQWSGDEVTTDKSLLDAVMLLSDEYADMRNTFLFINESWTVSHKEYYIRWPAPLHGAVLAATGNSESNVSDPMLDFADRSTLARDTIAVMNLDPVAGTVCSSSFIDEGDIDTAMAIGYDGTISADICGTSFAAPRVAWVLAADEATRKLPVKPQKWSATLQARLSSIRDPNSKKYLRLWLRPGRLLSLPH